MAKTSVAVAAMLLPLGALAGDLASQDSLTPPYTKNVISAVAQAATSVRSAETCAYAMTIYYSADRAAESSNFTGATLIPAPVAGAIPVTSLRNAAWVGTVQWRELNPDGSLGGSPEVFKDQVAYRAQVQWTLGSSQGKALGPVLQTSQRVYRDGSYAQAQTVPAENPPPTPAKKAPSDLGAITVSALAADNSEPRSAPSQVSSAYGPGVVDPVTHGSTITPRPIVLPDLEGVADANFAAPAKQAHKPVEQALPNGPAGLPYGSPSSPMSALSSGAPGALMGNANAPAGNNPYLPGMTNAPGQKGAPIPALNLGDAGAGASISPTTTDLRFESKNYLGHVGLNYLSPGSSYGLGVKADGSYLLGKTVALGTNVSVNNNLKEVVLSGVWMPEDTHLKAKLSTAYMVGAQSFGFYSGSSNANLSQASYYFSTDYVVPKEQSDYLHSVGVSTWGSKAKQTNNPDPVYSVVNTTSAYQIMMDPLKLAVGTLQGEAINAQVGMTKQVIAKVSAGYETLKFPFSDGTQELNKRIYQDYVVQYQPIPEVSLQAGYKIGAAMNNIMLSAAYGQWKLTSFKNNGVNGVTGNQGLALTYTIPLDGNPKAVAFGTLTRPELIGNSAYILRDAATRPVQLPQTFLAKVDTTAVKMVASINKANLPSGVTVTAAGDLLITVGAGVSAITSVTRNGAAYAYSSVMQVAGQNISIKSKLLPAAAASGDTYVIHATDTTNTPYLVTINTAN